jgi:hypothetical protein
MLRSILASCLAVAVLGLYSCKKQSSQPDFSYTGTLHVGYLVTFHSNVSGGSYLWTFGDGSKSTDANPNHTYNSPSSFMVTLTVNNDTAKRLSKVITIDAPFDFTISGTTAAGYPVTFTSNASTGDHYAWDFGDGSTSTSAAATHTFATNGTYQVSLVLNSDSSHIIKQAVYIFANAVYLPQMAGTKSWHHTYTDAVPWPPYHTTDTLADVSMAINFVSPYTMVVGADTLTYYSSYGSDSVIAFMHYDPYHNINNSLYFKPATSALDYYRDIHISAGAGDATDHYYTH